MSLCDWTGKGSLVSSSLTSIDNDNISSKATPISANDAPPTTGEKNENKNQTMLLLCKVTVGLSRCLVEQVKHFYQIEDDKGKLTAITSL